MNNQTFDELEEKLGQQPGLGSKFGTFTGVFTPTLLTILGVIMYLRIGWVVGNTGLLGGWLIIFLASLITFCTGLSMSSITTNIRIGAGGAFSIISQSLGLEMGGSIGIPLYLSQALAITMYIFGFREGWQWIFPQHPAIVIDLVVFLVLLIIALISANLAFKIQYFIMVIVALSIVSILIAFFQVTTFQPILWWVSDDNQATSGNFWQVFAVFFPAVTGIMAGANMSGDLKDPRRSIPLGTISAVVLSTLVYALLAYCLVRIATPQELRSNFTVLIDQAAYKPIVLAGLLGATFSSALASLIGSPRILYALGEHSILPYSKWFSIRDKKGEPRNSILFTATIVLVTLLVRDLNAIAPLITLFFLITYGMINTVVLIEQQLGLVSFRPTLAIPKWVPIIGALGCLFIMFIQNPTFSLIAITFVVFIYSLLSRSSIQAPFGDVRSGLFNAIAEWAAKRVVKLPGSSERTWQPNLVVPVESARQLRGSFRLIYSIIHPKGSIKVLGLTTDKEAARLNKQLPLLISEFNRHNVFASWAIIDGKGFSQTVIQALQALQGDFLRPNTIFLTINDSLEHRAELSLIINNLRYSDVGVILFVPHIAAGLGLEKSINLWVSGNSPSWEVKLELGNLNLGILVAYLIKQNWQAELTLSMIINKEEELPKGKDYLHTIAELARLPKDTKFEIAVAESLSSHLANAPTADLNIFGLGNNFDFDDLTNKVQILRSSCIFVLGSKDANALT